MDKDVTPTLSAPPRRDGPAAAEAATALAVADANWYTTEHLFREVEREGVSTLLLRCMDYRNALQRGLRPWSWSRPRSRRGPRLWQHDLVLPSGWMKRFPGLGMKPIARSVRDWRRAEAPSGRLVLVMTYPHYLYLRDLVRPAASVYFNLDDYTLYWPRRARDLRALERRAVLESDLTVCVSKRRADELRDLAPGAADRVRYLPHGSPSASVADRAWDAPAPPPADLAGLPRPLLGYVGTLEDRVDWRLLTRLSEAFPHGSVVLVGRPGPRSAEEWSGDRARCLARPNVHSLGWRPPDQLAAYNRAFDVCLIPYRTDHPFNLSCCPTKIMDAMGTGRPIVSTALPECRLYDQLFHVAEGDEAFVEAVRSVVASGSDDGRAGLRLAWARAHTCRKVADRLLDWLGG